MVRSCDALWQGTRQLLCIAAPLLLFVVFLLSLLSSCCVYLVQTESVRTLKFRLNLPTGDPVIVRRACTGHASESLYSIIPHLR